MFDADVSDPQYLQAHRDLVDRDQMASTFVVGTAADPFVEAIDRYGEYGFRPGGAPMLDE